MRSVIAAKQINREGARREIIGTGITFFDSARRHRVHWCKIEFSQLHTQAGWTVPRKDFFNDDFGLSNVL